HRPHAAQLWQRPAEQRVVAEALEELGVVVVEREDEAQLGDARLVRRAQVHDAIGLLPGAPYAAGGERGHERPVRPGPRRAPGVTCREAEREGAARSNRGRDHGLLSASTVSGSDARLAARSSTSSASCSRPAFRRNLPQARYASTKSRRWPCSSRTLVASRNASSASSVWPVSARPSASARSA